MPTPATAKWPRPKSEDEWEDMVLDAMCLRWRDPNATRNGRRGQRQNGVDIYGTCNGGIAAAQAKNVDKMDKSDAILEIAKAETFRPLLSEYHFAIGGPRDAGFQEFVRNLSTFRVHNGRFPVHVLFFEDVTHELSNEKRLVMKYWEQFLGGWLKAVSNELTEPILDIETALDRVQGLPEYRKMTEYLAGISGSGISIVLRIEQTPDLAAPAGDIRRFWKVAIGESTPQKATFLHRIAIDVEGRNVRIYQVVDDTWLTVDEWMKTLARD